MSILERCLLARGNFKYMYIHWLSIFVSLSPVTMSSVDRQSGLNRMTTVSPCSCIPVILEQHSSMHKLAWSVIMQQMPCHHTTIYQWFVLQIFIGFVIKQFEFIEEGQIRQSDTLVPDIFHFLILLSYERYHSKSIIGMPKIIQLCDGIMASGLEPTTHGWFSPGGNRPWQRCSTCKNQCFWIRYKLPHFNVFGFRHPKFLLKDAGLPPTSRNSSLTR